MKRWILPLLIIPIFIAACDSGRHIDKDDRIRRLRATSPHSVENFYIYLQYARLEGNRLRLDLFLSKSNHVFSPSLYIDLNTGKVLRYNGVINDSGIRVCTPANGPCDTFTVTPAASEITGITEVDGIQLGNYSLTLSFERTRQKYEIARYNANSNTWEHVGFADEYLFVAGSSGQASARRYIENTTLANSPVIRKALMDNASISMSFGEPLDGYTISDISFLDSASPMKIEATYMSLSDLSLRKEIFKFEEVKK